MKKSIISFAVLTAISNVAFAAYPEKPIRLIIPFAPGGTTDIVARAIVEPLSKEIGQPIVIENRAGQGGALGAIEVSTAENDGYTLGISTVSTTATNPAYQSNVGYNPIKDFTYIGNIAITPGLLAVSSKFPAKDYKSFDEVLKKSRGKYTYASSGQGGMAHLILETYKGLTKYSIIHMPYRGSAPALKDTAASKTDMVFDNYPSIQPYLASGELIPIAVASPNRISSLPNIPTFKELGFENANRVAFYGISGPADLPKDIVQKINTSLRNVLNQDEVKKAIEKTGSFVAGNTPEEFEKQVKNEYEAYKEIIKEQKLSPR